MGRAAAATGTRLPASQRAMAALRQLGGQSGNLSDDQMQLIARALADPRRYEILKKLGCAKSSATACSNIRDCISISPATLSHHMKELEMAGLIRSEKEGKFVNYFPQVKVIRAYLSRLRADLA